MFKRRFITTISALAGVGIGCIIDSYAGFPKNYIAITIASLLAFYWVVEFIIDTVYFCMFYDDEFQLFIAQKVNKTLVTYEEVKAKEKYYLKEFKRTLLL